MKHMIHPVRRATVVSSAATFRRRAGNAAYLASFCRVLRQLGFSVQVLFLDPIPRGQVHLDLHPDYLSSVDAAAVRGSVRLGSRFLSRNPKDWTHAAVKLPISILKSVGAHRSWQARSGVWHLRWPGEAALQWAARHIVTFQSDVVIANYFNASRVFPLIDFRCCKAILVHDVFALRQRSYEASGYPLDFEKKMVAAESEGLATADVCLTITPEESEFVRRHHPHVRTAVFPFVTEALAHAGRRSATERCLFIASDNDPNRRALAWLLHEVWPRVLQVNPRAELRVVGDLWIGDGLPRSPNVEIVGVVDDLRLEYAAASVVLVPLRAGSGLKVKLIEALANGVPVVSTSVGAAGIEAAPQSFLRVRDDSADFAKAVADLLSAANWSALSADALDFVRAEFSPSVAERALRNVFDISAPTRPLTWSQA